MAQAIHNPIRCPSMCESPPDPPIAIAQVRTAILDAISEADDVITGVLLLSINMDRGIHINFRRFILEAIERGNNVFAIAVCLDFTFLARRKARARGFPFPLSPGSKPGE
jgi:hypothetical protein